MIEYSIPLETADILADESIYVIGILSLILYHSTNTALEEASKSILLNTRIVSVVSTVIRAASSKGPALFDHDEGTSGGGTLISILLLNYFALRRYVDSFSDPFFTEVVKAKCSLVLVCMLSYQESCIGGTSLLLRIQQSPSPLLASLAMTYADSYILALQW